MMKILFVCLGNICRSPTADGIMQHLITHHNLQQRFSADSAGTAAFHSGEPPDPRSCAEAAKHGISLTHLRARKVRMQDFDEFDLVLAMDRSNLQNLLSICPAQLQHKVRLLLDYHPLLKGQDVPDPYYGGESGFERVFEMCQQACKQLIAEYGN